MLSHSTFFNFKLCYWLKRVPDQKEIGRTVTHGLSTRSQRLEIFFTCIVTDRHIAVITKWCCAASSKNISCWELEEQKIFAILFSDKIWTVFQQITKYRESGSSRKPEKYKEFFFLFCFMSVLESLQNKDYSSDYLLFKSSKFEMKIILCFRLHHDLDLYDCNSTCMHGC